MVGPNSTVMISQNLNICFDYVAAQGTSSVTKIIPPEEIPSNFNVVETPNYIDISTTATFTGPITISINYSNMSYTNESNLKLLHYENDHWVDCTTSIDTVDKILYGSVNSLSPFALLGATSESQNENPVIQPGNEVDDPNQDDNTNKPEDEQDNDDGQDSGDGQDNGDGSGVQDSVAANSDIIQYNTLNATNQGNSSDNTVGMQTTGAPVIPLLLGMLMVLAGVLKRK